MVSAQMIKENEVIEKVLLTKITPRVRKNFSLPVISHISMFDMTCKLLDMIKLLFLYKHQSTFQTNLAISFIVINL